MTAQRRPRDNDVWWIVLALAVVIIGLLVLFLFSVGSGGSGID